MRKAEDLVALNPVGVDGAHVAESFERLRCREDVVNHALEIGSKHSAMSAQTTAASVRATATAATAASARDLREIRRIGGVQVDATFEADFMPKLMIVVIVSVESVECHAGIKALEIFVRLRYGAVKQILDDARVGQRVAVDAEDERHVLKARGGGEIVSAKREMLT